MAEKQVRLGEEPGGTRTPFAILDGFVDHPYLVPRTVEARDYQVNVAADAVRKNALVVLPTGLGKTLIAVLVIAEALREKRGRIVFLAPTRPLSLQHVDTLQRVLRDAGLLQHLSGVTAPEKRADLWRKALIVVATPQTIRNDLDGGRYDFKDVGLLIIDEAHRGVGDYAYGDIAQQFRRDNPRGRVLGLTASPGAKKERLQEVREQLGVEIILARDTASGDVTPYVHHVEPEIVRVKLTPLIRTFQQEFQSYLSEQEAKLRQFQAVQGDRAFGVTKRELIGIMQSRGHSRGAGGPPNWPAVQVAQKALYATICLEHLETQGLVPLKRYLDRMMAKEDPKRMEKSFSKDERVIRAQERLAKGIESSHPKIDELIRRVKDEKARKPDVTAIVFTQYRDTVDSIVEALTAAGISARRLVGQAKKGDAGGQSQDEQREVLERFGARAFNVLVSTSIGEEGLDVPQVDLVVFYEAVPSEIRAVQRRGRTGRTVPGRVIVLISEGTRDEAFLRSQEAKEGKMRRLIRRFA